MAVSLEPAEPGRFRAVAPTAAPFALTLPVSVVNGEIDGGATTLTIPAGMVHSDSVSVTRIGVFAVTADIGTLPGLPSEHRGYALEKSSGLPLEVFAVNAAPSTCTLNTGDLWCGVVTVGELGDGDGFLNTIGGLSDTEFDYGTTRYTITSVHVSDSMALGFNLNAALTDAARDKLVLRVGATSFAFSDATYFPGSKSYLWSSTGLDWSSETLVTLHLWSPDNNAPLFAETMATRTVPENSPAGTDVGAAVTATDADSGDTLTYSLEGTDAGSFTIVETSGQIRTVTGVTYDHEAPQNSYSVTVKADDSADGTDTIAVTINVTDDDTEAPDTPDAPYVSAASATSLNVTWSAPDNAGPAITDYDYRYFQRMDSPVGEWSEVADTTITALSATIGGLQEDAYHFVQVRATNDEGTSGWSSAGSGRTDANAAPAFTSSPTFDAAENQTAVGTVEAEDYDPDDGIQGYAISGGADAGFFSIFRAPAGPPVGVLTFDDAPNFEDAQDQGADNTYKLEVQATSGAGDRERTVTLAITVTVTDDDHEAPHAPAAPSVSGASVTSLSVTWLAPDNAGPAITDYDYRYRTSSPQGAWVEVADTTITGPSATIGSLQENTSYDVQVRATNDEGTGAWSDASTASTNDLPTLSVEDASGDEGGNVTFTVTLSEAARENLTATWTASIEIGDTAEEADFVDLSAATGTETIMEGQMTATFTVVTADDTRDEDDETFTVTVSVKANEALAATTTAEGTIKDDDKMPTVSIGDATAVEHGTMSPRLTISAESEKVVTIVWTASIKPDDTAEEADFVDLSAATGSVTFRPGMGLELLFTMHDVVADDALDEDRETFTVTLSQPRNAILAPDSSTGRMTIRDNDPEPSVSVDDASAFEGDALEFTVRLLPASGRDVMVDWATSVKTGDTATSGTDFTAASDTLTIAAGETTGTITVSTTDDPTDEPNETFTVTLSNPRNAEISDATATGTITDNDEPNAAPAFTSDATFGAAENQTAVGTVEAEDDDAGDDITGYALSGGADQGFFSIGATSGALTFDDAPNFEAPQDQGADNTYALTVQASSGAGERAKTATQAITVTVRDDNTEAPAAPDAPSVSPASVTSLNVSWSAPDNAGPEITDYDYRYRTTLPPGAWVEVTNTTITARSTTIGSLQENTSYDVQVRATNDEGTSDWSDSGSDATDANMAPSFTSSDTFTPAENQTTVGTVVASDDDTGDDITDYALSGGADQALFSIGSTSGVLTFQAAPNYEDPQDANTDNAYLVVVQATSGTGDREQTGTQTITVTVMDDDTEAPAAPDAPSVSPASVTSLNVSWSAPDNAGPEITDYDVQYRAGASEPWSDGSHIGTALTAILTGLLEDTSYQVQVRATNAEGTGGWSASGSGETDANAAPSFTSAAMFNPAENQTAVGTVVASDSDTGDAITDYALSGGADQALFSIGSTSGVLTFQAAPNYEDPQDANTDNAYLVVVQATSGTGDREQTATQTITVTVMDANEQPDIPATPTVMATSGTTDSLDVTWTEPGLNGGPAIIGYGVQYRVVTSVTWVNWTHSGTGTTTMITGLTANTEHQVRVQALNGETPSAWSDPSVAVPTNAAANNAPVFSETAPTRGVAENSAAGVDVGTAVTATDADPGDTLTYTLEGTDVASFDIVATSGQIRTKTGVTYDHEEQSSYSVTVRASDGTASATIDVEITVTDEDEQPDTPAKPTVSATSGTTDSLDVTWTEPGRNGGPELIGYTVEYREGTSGDWENVTHSGTGTTTTITGLTASTEYQVRVQALNGETPSAWSDPSVAVPTNSASNNAPVFSETAPTRGVAENSAAGVDVGTAVTATDVDPGDTLTYTLEGTDVALFDIVSTSGQIRTKTGVTYDHEEQSSYSVTVRASDGTASATIDVEITVTDEDEQPDKPAKPTLAAVSGATDSLDASWTKPGLNGGPDITGYAVEYRQGTSGTWTNWMHTGTGTATTITGLTANTEYQVRVQALNGETPSDWSDPSDAATTVAAGPPATNAALPPPQDVNAEPLLPGEIRLGWWRNPDDASHELVDRHQYRYRVRDASTWTVDWTTVNQTMLPGTSEIRNYNSVLLKELTAWTTYEFQVRSVDKDGGTSAVVTALGTAVGRQTVWIEADTRSVEEGEPLRFALSRDQPHGRLMVILRISETGDMLPPEGRSPEGYWYENVHFGDGNATIPVVLDTVNDGGGPEPNSAVTVEVMPYPLAPDNPDKEHLYEVRPELRAGTATVTAAEGSSHGGAAEPLTAAFEGLPEAHDGETAFTVRLVFSEAVSVTPEAMRTRVLTVEGGAVTGAARVDGETGVWAITVTPDTREALSITLAPAAECAADGAVCTADGRALSTGASAIVNGPGPESQTEEDQALTASFERVPGAHDGERAFRFHVAFSEDIGIDYQALRDDAFTVSGGAVTEVRGVDGRYDRWEITVAPDSDGDVAITLPAGRACEVSGAICTTGEHGRRLSNSPSATVAGPADEPESNTAAAGAPTISGTPQVGEALTASTSGISDADGLDTAGFAYQWIRTDTDIQGATGSTYTAVDADEGERLKVRVSFTDDAGHEERLTSAATDAVAAAPEPLTASFEGMPAEHRGQGSFSFRVAFSDGISISYKTVRDASFTVTGGDVTRARRVDGRRDLWKITIEPASHEALTVRLPETTDCDASGAICTDDGRPLSHALSATVAGSVGIAVADARVDENSGALLAFAVTLSRAASAALTVDYATADGSAHAGDDYRAASGTLKFRAGESSKTIEVAVFDDAHDEGEETLTLRLSNPSGGRLADGEATGTIANHDSMPRALLARFGRTAAVHVVEHVEERLAAPRAPGFRGRFAGRELRRGMERDIALSFLRRLGGVAGAGPMGAGAGGSLSGASATGTAPLGMSGLAGDGRLAAASGPMGMVAGPLGGGSRPDSQFNGGGLARMGLGGGDVLTGSAFELGRETGHGGILSFWSRGARSRFSGREGALSLGGDVRTTMVGADYATGPLVTGLSLSHSRGLGEYTGSAGGQVASSVTGLYPWLGYKATDRVTVWGVAGYGSGGLLLTPQGGPALESGLSMAMAAAGTRGELVAGGAGGFALAFKADALWVGTSIDGVDGAAGRLKATDTAVTRFRTGLEGSRAYTLAGRLSLKPSVEVGLRHDGGDAETGAGMDVGLGLIVSDAGSGLAVDVRVRTLVLHQAEGFRERGMALSLSYNPTPSTPLGFMARVAPSWGGQATSGAQALWGRQTMAGLASGGVASGNRLDGEVGYGLPMGRRFVGTPRVGFSTSEHGRDYRLGYGLGVLKPENLTFELGIDAQRRESPLLGGASNGAVGRGTLGW